MRRPIILAALLVSLVAGSSTAAEFNLDSLLAASMGGPDGVAALRQLKNMSAEGEIILNGQSGRFTEHVQPPMSLYQRLEFGPVSLVQGFDGRIAWQQDFNGRVTYLNGFERRAFVTSAYFETASYLFDDRLPGEMAYAGDTTIDGTAYHRVIFYPLMEDTVTSFFEVSTARLVFTLARIDQYMMKTSYSEFRDTLGLVWPTHSIGQALNAPLTVEMKLERLSFDDDLSDVPFSPPGDESRDFRFPPGVASVQIPIDYNFGHISVVGTINGERRVRLILDSGASMNLYNKSALEGLHIEEVGQMPAQGVSGFDQVSLVQTDSVAIGGLTLLGQVGGVIDLGWLAGMQDTTEQFGGLLGYDFLSRFPILIDYEASEMTVFNPDGFEAPAGGTEVPFSLTMQVPTVEANVCGVPGEFIVDLGNAMELILHRPFYDKNRLDTLLADVGGAKIQAGGVGGAGMATTALAPRVVIGGVEVDSVEAVIPDSDAGFSGSQEIEGNIGNQLLSRFRLLLDYGNSRMILYPRGDEK